MPSLDTSVRVSWRGCSQGTDLIWAVHRGGYNKDLPLITEYPGALACVRDILKIPGLDIQAADEEGKTALTHAIEKGRECSNLQKKSHSGDTVSLNVCG